MTTGQDQVRVYGEQWFPIRVDWVKKSISMDELGCTWSAKLNNVKVTKMRWLSRTGSRTWAVEGLVRLWDSSVDQLTRG